MFGKTRIGNICYYVSDIARTETFYRDVLGLEVMNMGDDDETPGANTGGGRVPTHEVRDMAGLADLLA